MTYVYRALIYSVLLLVMFASAVMVYAQDTDPPPSKTPTPVNQSEPNSTDVPSADLTFTIEEPFIQSDLTILSGNVQRPNGLFWHNGNVYAACSGDWTIYEIDAETGATITYIWGIRNAHTLHAEDDEVGNLDLWVPDYQTNTLARIYRGGIQEIVTGLEGPWGISDINGEGFLITNLLGDNLVYALRTGETREVVRGLRSPAGIVVDDEVVYIANNGSARRAIEWFDLGIIEDDSPIDASVENSGHSLISGLQNPTGLAMGPDGYLYFAYSLGTRGVIGRVQPEVCLEQGGCTNNEVEIVVYTDLAAPISGLTFSPDMDLYMHTIFSPDIYYVNLGQEARTTARR